MTIQLSDCCKATIDLDKTKERPECYTCSKCGRIIGSPLTHNTREEARKRYIEMWDKGEFEWNHHEGDVLGKKPISPERIWQSFIEPLLTTAAREKEEAVAEVVERWRKSIDDEARSCSVKIEEALDYYRNHLFDVHHCNCALTPPKNISSNETTV